MLEQLEEVLIKFTSLTLENKDQNSIKELEIDELQRIIAKILKSPEMSSSIFEPSARPMLGQLISIFLAAFSQMKISSEIRVKCGSILCSITDEKHKENSADFVAFILPGIFSACQNVLLSDLNEMKSLEIVNSASKVLTNILTVAFTNLAENANFEVNNPDESPNVLIAFKRDEKWIKMAKEKILIQLTFMFSRMSVHRIGAIRLESIKIATKIYEQNIYRHEFDRIVFDLVSILLDDDFPSIQSLCGDLVAKLQSNKEIIESYAVQKLTKALKTLESDVKNASSGQKYLENFVNLCKMIDSELLNRLFTSNDFMERFFLSILSIIAVDSSKQLVSNYQQEGGDIHTFSLKYGINEKQIQSLMHTLITLPNFEDIFDYLLDNFDENINLKRKISIAFVLLQIFCTAFLLEDEVQMRNTMSQFLPNVLEVLKTMEPLVEENVSDKQIEEIVPSNSQETSLIKLLIHCLSLFQFKQIPAKFVGDLLYELLKWSSSSNFPIKAAADECLKNYSNQENASSSQSPMSTFILANIHRIMFKVSLASHDFALNPRFPLVIAELVSRCSNPQMFYEIRAGIGEVIFWLDRSAQNQTMLLLRALRNYTKAMLKWFPNLKPPSSNETDIFEEKAKNKCDLDPNYPLISNSITILNRTKHFISSKNLPIQLLILDILNYSLEFIKNYEDELLPMIHQNWHGLVVKLGDGGKMLKPMTESEKLVAVRAIQVVERICHISTDFVHRKIVDDFIPRAQLLLKTFARSTTNGSNSNNGFDRHTSTYRLQLALIVSIPTILSKSNVAEPEHIEPLKRLLASYSNSPEFPDELRRKALESLREFDKIQKEL